MARINRRMGSGRMEGVLRSLGQDVTDTVNYAADLIVDPNTGDITNAASDASQLNVNPSTGDIWLASNAGGSTPLPSPTQPGASSGFSFNNILNTLEQAVHYTTHGTPSGGVQIVPKSPSPSPAMPAWVLPVGIAALALAVLRR